MGKANPDNHPLTVVVEFQKIQKWGKSRRQLKLWTSQTGGATLVPGSLGGKKNLSYTLDFRSSPRGLVCTIYIQLLRAKAIVSSLKILVCVSHVRDPEEEYPGLTYRSAASSSKTSRSGTSRCIHKVCIVSLGEKKQKKKYFSHLLFLSRVSPWITYHLLPLEPSDIKNITLSPHAILHKTLETVLYPLPSPSK